MYIYESENANEFGIHFLKKSVIAVSLRSEIRLVACKPLLIISLTFNMYVLCNYTFSSIIARMHNGNSFHVQYANRFLFTIMFLLIYFLHKNVEI